MDNDKQALNGQPFNLHAYGLVYDLLSQGVPVHWVIRSGKLKDEIDFSAQASRVYPTPAASAMLDFRGSAFIIDAAEVADEFTCGGITTSMVDAVITTVGHQVAVYRLDQSASVDVRYTLTYAPLIAVLDDGNASETGGNIFDSAGVYFEYLTFTEFEANNTCFTFIAQPHICDGTSSSCSNIDLPYYSSIVTSFLNSGGNFFAQCASIPTFEDEVNYLTTNGITEYGVLGNNDQPLGANLNYDNNDMPVMQFHGPTIGYEVGRTYHFSLDGGGFQPYAYSGIWKNYNGNPSYLVTAGDVNGAALGGNVFYLAGHDYTPNDNITPTGNAGTPFSSTVIESYNLNRVALNAAFVPASQTATCVGPDRCICPGDAISIGCSDTAPIPYTWSPATGLSCTDCPNPIASPSVTTTYTATGPGGCSANTVQVIVDCPIIVASQDIICNGDCATITIDEQITNTPVTLEIDGTPQPYTSTVTSLCPTTTTTYTFTVIDDFGITYSDEVTVEVFPEVTPVITATNEICSGETISFSAPGVLNPQWYTTESLSCINCNAPSLELVDDFTIEVIGVDANGCEVRDDYSQVVYETPAVVLTVEEGPMCEGTTITLTAAGADNFQWPAGETMPSISYTLVSTGTVSVIGTTVDGCSSTAEEEVPVNPIIPIVIEDQVFMCITDSCITLNAVNVTSVEWLLEDGTVVSNELSFEVCPQAPTAYIAQTDNTGCFEPDQVLVDIVLVPQVVARPDTLICPGTPVQLYASGADHYSWTNQEGDVYEGDAPEVAPLVSQVYEVEGSTVVGCSSSDVVVVNTLPSPGAAFEVEAPDGFFSLLPINFINTSIAADCAVWTVHESPAVGSTSENFQHVFSDPGIYPVDLWVCNDLGCWDSVTHTISIGSEFYFYVPSAFTPNPEDDVNSVFKVYGTNISSVDFEMNIFNRWGEVIYTLKNPDEVWLGNHHDNAGYFVPDGVYNWQLRLRDKYSLQRYEAAGHVVIFR
jgi:gliding motility-associated-like protein